MPNYFRPIVIAADGRQQIAAQPGTVMDIMYIPVSPRDGNKVVADESGLFVSVASFISSASDNDLKQALDGGLYVQANDAKKILSSDVGQLLQLDNTGKLLLSARSIMSDDDENALSVGSDGGLMMTPPTLLSLQDGNMLRFGKDKGLFLDANDVLSNSKVNIITIGEDGKLLLTKKDIGPGVSLDPGNMLTEGKDGGIYLDVMMLLSEASGNQLTVDSTGKLYVREPQAAPLMNVEDKVLFVNAEGKIASELGLRFDTTTGQLTLRGVGGQTVAEVWVPTTVRVLKSVAFEENPEGQPEGAYLHFSFLLADNTTQDVYVNVSQLIDTYVAGNGVVIADRVVGVRVSDAGGLGFDVDGALRVVPSELVSDHKGNRVILDKDGKLYGQPYYQGDGVAIEGNTIRVRSVNGEGIGYDADGALVVKAVDMLSAEPGNALHVDGAGKIYAHVPPPLQAGDGITIQNDKVSVRLAQASGLATVGGQLVAVVADMVEPGAGNALTLGDTGKLQVTLPEQKKYGAGNGIAISDNDVIFIDMLPGTGLGFFDGSLRAVPADMLSKELGNALVVDAEGKLRVDQSKLQQLRAGGGVDITDDVISMKVARGLSIDTDDYVYVDSSKVLDSDPANALSVGPNGGLMLSKGSLGPADVVSQELGNILQEAADDGGAYLSADYGTMD